MLILLSSIVNKEKRKYLREKYNVKTAKNIHSLCEVDIIILAIKPQSMTECLSILIQSIPENALIISLAAGLSLKYIHTYLPNHSVIRAMPNTPSFCKKV